MVKNLRSYAHGVDIELKNNKKPLARQYRIVYYEKITPIFLPDIEKHRCLRCGFEVQSQPEIFEKESYYEANYRRENLRY